MEDKQLLMENKIKEIIKLLAGEDRRNDVEKMMQPYFVRCNYEEKSLTIGYDVAEWELNPQGVMHGGMITTAFDNAFGILTHFFAQESFITTVELGVHFHKPVFLGDKIEITGMYVDENENIFIKKAEGNVSDGEKIAQNLAKTLKAGGVGK